MMLVAIQSSVKKDAFLPPKLISMYRLHPSATQVSYTVLKTYHGRGTSSTQAFLQRVGEYAKLAAGRAGRDMLRAAAS
jgi:hypothetical protein